MGLNHRFPRYHSFRKEGRCVRSNAISGASTTLFQRLPDFARQLIEKESPDYLRSVAFEGFLDFLVDQLRWEPLVWDESGLTVEAFRSRVQKRDQFFDRTFAVDVDFLRFRLPLHHHPQRDLYFKSEPKMQRGIEPEWRFEGDFLVLDAEAKEDAKDKFLDDVRFWIGGRNKEMEEGNPKIRDAIRPVWEAHRKAVDEQASKLDAILQLCVGQHVSYPSL